MTQPPPTNWTPPPPGWAPPPPPGTRPPRNRKAIAAVAAGVATITVLFGIAYGVKAHDEASDSPTTASDTAASDATGGGLRIVKPATAQPHKAPSPAPTHAHHPAKAPAPSCSPTRDVIVRYVEPGLPPSAQVLGNYDLQSCESTFQSLTETSPTGPGYCTEAAWASDNPGYNADATPAEPLRKVQVAIGPAC